MDGAKLEWMVNRREFILKAAAVMIEAGIPVYNAEHEANEMFELAKEHIRVTYYGAQTNEQMRVSYNVAERPVRALFVKQLLRAVDRKLPQE